MKKILWLLVLILACEGPMGPQGEQGLTGQQGEQGLPGEQGEPGVANISVVNFSVSSTQWISIDSEKYYFYKSITAITSSVSSSGAVLVYVKYPDVTPDEWWALPATLSWDVDDDMALDYSEELTYIYTVGGVWVHWESSYPLGVLPDRDFKVVIIPPASLAKYLASNSIL